MVPVLRIVICLLLLLTHLQDGFSQETFFSARGRERRVNVLDTWYDEATKFAQTRHFHISGEKIVFDKYRLDRSYIAFKDDIFKKYFGKTFGELTADEMEEIGDFIHVRFASTRYTVQINSVLKNVFLTEKRSKQIYPHERYEPQDKVFAAIKEMNSPDTFRPLKGQPTPTNKQSVIAACLGAKLVDAIFEANVKGVIVTEVQIGGAAYLAGIQPGDMILSFIKPGVTEQDKFYRADLIDIRSASELANNSCNSALMHISYNMIYKDPVINKYRPFTGKILFGMKAEEQGNGLPG